MIASENLIPEYELRKQTEIKNIHPQKVERNKTGNQCDFFKSKY